MNGKELSPKSKEDQTLVKVKKEIGARVAIGNKTISAMSASGVSAAQQVTPQRLSNLLLSRGPLAIRFITQALASEIAGFKDLSASKQRRLIMSALDAGDLEHSVVFAKIGWGQWSAKKVDPETFEQERETTNIANAKVKDMVSQERRRSSSSKKHVAKKDLGLSRVGRTTFIDENALASEDEDEGEEGDEEGGTLNYDHFKRRKSSVVFADSPPEDIDHELISHAIRPILKNSHRRSSSKLRSPSVSKPGSYRSSVASLGSNGSGDAAEATFRRLSVTEHHSRSMVDLQASTDKDAELLQGRSRREPRLSFSKESSIRSTLLSHTHSRTSPPTPSQQPLNPGNTDRLPRYHLNNLSSQTLEDLDHSDTDEEDWEHIGAASLRNSCGPPSLQSPDPASAGPVSTVTQSTYLKLKSPPITQGIPEPGPFRKEPEDAKDAAFLLMSLKS